MIRLLMIKSFKDSLTEDTYNGVVRKGFPADLIKVLDDLKAPPGNRLEALVGDRKGQHSIRVNDQFRICFVWTNEGPKDVEFIDYH